jgi:hypothetical protein
LNAKLFLAGDFDIQTTASTGKVKVPANVQETTQHGGRKQDFVS